MASYLDFESPSLSRLRKTYEETDREMEVTPPKLYARPDSEMTVSPQAPKPMSQAERMKQQYLADQATLQRTQSRYGMREPATTASMDDRMAYLEAKKRMTLDSGERRDIASRISALQSEQTGGSPLERAIQAKERQEQAKLQNKLDVEEVKIGSKMALQREKIDADKAIKREMIAADLNLRNLNSEDKFKLMDKEYDREIDVLEKKKEIAKSAAEQLAITEEQNMKLKAKLELLAEGKTVSKTETYSPTGIQTDTKTTVPDLSKVDELSGKPNVNSPEAALAAGQGGDNDADKNGVPDDTKWVEPASGKSYDMNKIVNWINQYELLAEDDPLRKRNEALYALSLKRKQLWLNSKGKEKE